MQFLKKYDLIKNCQFSLSKNDDDWSYKCVHCDIVLAGAGLYLHYIYGENFRLDFTINGKTYTTNELTDFLKLIKLLKRDLNEIESDKQKFLMVYTWNLKEVEVFFKKNDKFPSEVVIDNTIILRDIRSIVPVSSLEDFAVDWYKVDVHTAPSVLFGKFSDDIAKEYCIKGSNGKIFKTSAQMAKYELKQKAPEFIKSWINHVVPYQDVYTFLRYECFRASLCTNNGDNIYKNVISYDQSSAHAHKLVCKEFPISKPVKAAMNHDIDWYFEHKWCWFNAHFKNVAPKDGFENIDTFKVKRQKNITLAMSLVQLEAFTLCYDYESVEFTDLIIADKGYLPDWIRCAIADMYMEKASYKIKDAHRNAVKVKLNSGSYGIHVERLYDWIEKDEDGVEHIKHYSNSQWADAWKNRLMPPQVGITITDYVFLDEVKIISANPYAFAYCDTDSVKSELNEYTMAAIELRNNESHSEIKKFCDQFKYDYELMKDLGEYKQDGEYNLFKAVCPKEYIYLTKDGKLGATTAGFAAHYLASEYPSHYHFEKEMIPVILKEPIEKKLDPFRYFSMGSKYTDYKWVWYKDDKLRVKQEFKLTIKENALLEHEMRERYEA